MTGEREDIQRFTEGILEVWLDAELGQSLHLDYVCLGDEPAIDVSLVASVERRRGARRTVLYSEIRDHFPGPLGLAKDTIRRLRLDIVAAECKEGGR